MVSREASTLPDIVTAKVMNEPQKRPGGLRMLCVEDDLSNLARIVLCSIVLQL